MRRILIILLLLGMLAPTLAAPPAWLAEWKRICASPHVSPEMGRAEIILKIDKEARQRQDGPARERYSLVGMKGEQGFLFLSPHDGSISTFVWYPTLPIERPITPATPEQITAVATKFVREVYPNARGVETIGIPDKYRQNGAADITFTYRYEDIEVRSLTIGVHARGYVVSNYIYDLARNSQRDVYADITPSPGEATIRKEVRAYLDTHNEQNAVIRHLIRTLRYDHDTPRLEWDIYLDKPGQNDDGHVAEGLYLSALTFNEATRQCRLEPWMKDQHYSCKQQAQISNIDPRMPQPAASGLATNIVPITITWSSDGTQIWGRCKARWREQHVWDDNIQSSLLVTDIASGKKSIYRPLVDTDRSWIGYSDPALSPDGRWLAVSIDVSTIVDLANNRMYCPNSRDAFGLTDTDPMHWSSDSTCLIFSTDTAITVATVASASGIPFADRPQHYPVKGEVIDVAFLPESTTECLALVSSKNGEKTLQRIHLLANGKIEAKVIGTTTTEQLVAPAHGTRVYLQERNQVRVLDLTTGAITPLSWLARDAAIGEGLHIGGTHFAWGVSPDGTRVAFTAYTAEQSDVLCTADIDGTNLRVVPPSKDTAPLSRYFLQGRFATVPLEAVPLPVIRSLYHITLPEWQPPLPPGGPWDRR